MKKLFKIGFRCGIGIGGLIAIVLLVSLDTVDYQPYFRTSYHQNTVECLQTRVATNAAIQGELFAGFGCARLTPTINAAQDLPEQGQFRSLPLAGYGSRRGGAATGVHDDLYVKAAALRVGDRLGVMVGTDALIVPAEVTDLAMQRLEREAGLRREQVYLSASHSHSSLGGWGEGLVAEAFAGGFQPGSRIWFADRIVTAVREAIADLQPATFGRGHFDAPELIRNRLVGALGQVDPEFSWLLFQQSNGRRIVLGSYSAHATVLSGSSMVFSADYPGSWQRAVETAPGTAAIFQAGGVGSQSPVAPGTNGFDRAEQMGRALAQRTLAQLTEVSLTNCVVFNLLGLEVALPPLNVRVSDGLRLRPWLARELLPVRPSSFLQVFRINDTVWISTPCDYSAELTLGVKDYLRARGYSGVITSFNGDYVGYVVPARYYHLNGYEPRLMSFFGPNVPDYFDELIRAMATAMITQ